MTFLEAALRARAALLAGGLLPGTARLDADLLARHAAGWDLATWLVRRSEPIDESFAQEYEALIQRRLQREPVAYIRGVQEFWGRDFRVTPDVLIPRPETELLVESAIALLRDHPRSVVVDVGTGSGCIAISLALEHPDITVFGTDISDAALAVARENASRYGVDERVRFLHGAYLASAPRPIGLIVSNPPYVSERDKPALAPEVRDHEPHVALFGGADGWRDIRHILREAVAALTPAGHLLVELGYGQSDKLAAEVTAVPHLHLDEVRADLQGIPRLGIIRRVA